MNDKQASLQFVSKIQDAYFQTGRMLNRKVSMMLILSVVLVLLSTGMVKIDQDFSLLGFKFQISVWVILYTVSWVLALVVLSIGGLARHEEQLNTEILRIYAELGFVDHSSSRLDSVSACEFPKLISLVCSKENLKLGSKTSVYLERILGVLWLILPIIGQGFAVYTLCSILGIRWWVVCSYLVMFAAIVLCYLAIIFGDW
tara:strand:- start:423 stop:1025 length:603 start_codon:yes stop_codon:yes gene_type:complete